MLVDKQKSKLTVVLLPPLDDAFGTVPEPTIGEVSPEVLVA